VTITDALLIALLLVATALCAVGIWALVEFVKTARSIRTLADDVDVRAVPLLDKADVTVDALNAELWRIDGIVTRVEEVTERVDNTTRTVQEVANAPAEIVNDLAGRVRRAWKTRGRPHEGAHDQAAGPEGADSDAQSADAHPGEYDGPAEAESPEPTETANSDSSVEPPEGWDPNES